MITRYQKTIGIGVLTTILLSSPFVINQVSADSNIKEKVKIETIEEHKINQDNEMMQKIKEKRLSIISSEDILARKNQSNTYFSTLNLTDQQKTNGQNELNNIKSLKEFDSFDVKYKNLSEEKTRKDEEAKREKEEKAKREEEEKAKAEAEAQKQKELEETTQQQTQQPYSENSPSVVLSNGNTAGEVGTYAAKKMAEVTGVPQSTWEYIIARESNGNPNAQNPSGASGLFQTMPFWGDVSTVDAQINTALKAYNEAKRVFGNGLQPWGM